MLNRRSSRHRRRAKRASMYKGIEVITGTGLITQLGNNISGTITLFSTETKIGDRITSAGGAINGLVTSITSNILLAIDTSTTVAVGIEYQITRYL